MKKNGDMERKDIQRCMIFEHAEHGKVMFMEWKGCGALVALDGGAGKLTFVNEGEVLQNEKR